MSLSDARPDGVAASAPEAIRDPAQGWVRCSTWVRHGAIIAVAALSTVLVGCEGGGFRPLYATGPTGSSATLDRMAQVEISTIPSRVGQRIRNELIFQATGGAGVAVSPLYRLDIAIRESVLSSMVSRTGDTAAQIYNLDAKFKLTRLSDKKLVLEGTSFGRAAFERYTAIYSNVRAKYDAEDRAARAIAEDLKGRLAGFLSSTN
jgi:LPS-assembly lipoprotein